MKYDWRCTESRRYSSFITFHIETNFCQWFEGQASIPQLNQACVWGLPARACMHIYIFLQIHYFDFALPCHTQLLCGVLSGSAVQRRRQKDETTLFVSGRISNMCISCHYYQHSATHAKSVISSSPIKNSPPHLPSPTVTGSMTRISVCTVPRARPDHKNIIHYALLHIHLL